MKLALVDIGQQFLNNVTGGKSGTYGSLTGISAMVSLILKIAFVVAGIFLLFYFILGGIGIMTAAGKGDPKSAEQAKATLTSAAIGFVVVFTAYWIVKLIGNLLGMPAII